MLWIGTSGWQYADWRGRLYPRGVPQRLWLEHYAARFRTVEVNASFYRLPKPETFRAWAARTPDDFVVVTKASRYLTHIRRLRDPRDSVDRFMASVRELGRKTGPVLLQLPPRFEAVPDDLDETLRAFPAGVRVAVEPRDASWWSDEVRAVLERHGAALSWADRREEAVTPLWRTAGWGYVRLHEGCAKARPSYRRSTLEAWVRRIEEAFARDDDVFVFFNNDPTGAAPHDAVTLARLAREAGWKTTRVPDPDEVELTPARG